MQAMTESVNCLSEEVSHAATKMTRPHLSRLSDDKLHPRLRSPANLPLLHSQVNSLTQKFKDEVQAYKSNQGY